MNSRHPLARLGRIGLLAGVLVALPAAAGLCYVVSDPTSLVKNTVVAGEGIQGALQRAMAFVTQLQQLQVAAKQLHAGTDLSGLSRTASDLAEANRLVGDLQNLYGSVSTVQAAITRRLDEAKVAGLDWDAYLTAEAGRIEKNNANAVARVAEEARIIARVQQDFAIANQTASKISGTSGMHDAMRVMNAQANQMVVQLAQLQRIMAPRAVAPGTTAEIRAQRAAKQAEQLRRSEIMENTRKAMRESEQRAKQILEGAPQ